MLFRPLCIPILMIEIPFEKFQKIWSIDFLHPQSSLYLCTRQAKLNFSCFIFIKTLSFKVQLVCTWYFHDPLSSHIYFCHRLRHNIRPILPIWDNQIHYCIPFLRYWVGNSWKIKIRAKVRFWFFTCFYVLLGVLIKVLVLTPRLWGNTFFITFASFILAAIPIIRHSPTQRPFTLWLFATMYVTRFH